MRRTERNAGSQAAAGLEADVEPASPDLVVAADQGAVHRLYRDHSASLVRQLTRQTGCRELARELAQETFVRLLRMAPAQIRSIARPHAYLRTMAMNLARDLGRRSACDGRLRDQLERLADPLLDQVAVLESRDTLRRLEAAMDRLRPRTREIFMAHRIEGLSYAEIAERTGLTVKGVEKQMSKAIAKIDRLLDRV